MSHTTALKTAVKSLEIARLAAEALGLSLTEVGGTTGKRVKMYDGQQPKGLAAVLLPQSYKGNTEDLWGVYLCKQADDTFEFAADWGYGLSRNATWAQKVADTGKTLLQYAFGEQREKKFASEYERPRTCLPFLQEYGRQFGYLDAQFHGRSVEETMDAHGARTLIMTDGDLLPGEAIHMTVNPDGSTTLAAVGFSGGRCKLATETLEAALGAVVNEEFKDEFFHQQGEQGLTHNGS